MTDKHERDRLPPVPEAPKLARRFSLGGILGRKKHPSQNQSHKSQNQSYKNQNHLHKEQKEISPTFLNRTTSLINVTSMGANMASPSISPPSSLHSPSHYPSRSKSLMGTVQKIFRRRPSSSAHHTSTPSHLVSSLYLQSEQEAQTGLQFVTPHSTTINESLPESDKAISIGTQKQLKTVQEAFNKRITPLTSAMRVLITSRCIFEAGENQNRLVQGVMIVSTKKITFSSSISHPPYQLLIDYTDIVAIIPSGDRTGIKLATQLTCLHFGAFPEREEVLRVLMNEWLIHCRHNLLVSTPLSAPLHDLPVTASCLWFRKSFAGAPVQTLVEEATNKEVPLRRAKSLIDKERAEVMSGGTAALPLTFKWPCACTEHYKNDIIQLVMHSTPGAVAGILFGLSGSGVAYAGTFFTARGGNTIEESRWTIEGETRKRQVIANVPDAFHPSTMMRVEIIQKVLRETADVLVSDARVDLRQTSFGNNYQFRIRWCIYRLLPLTEDRCSVNLSAEVRTVGPVPLPVATVEGRMLAFMKQNFAAMLETLRVRLEVATRQEKPVIVNVPPGNSMIGIALRELLFLTIYRIMESIQGLTHRVTKFKITRKFVTIVMAMVLTGYLIFISARQARWFNFLSSSSSSASSILSPTKFEGIIFPNTNIISSNDGDLIGNATKVAQFIKDHIH